MRLINGLAKLAEETMRIKRTANQEDTLNSQTKQKVETLKQKTHNSDINPIYDLGGCYYNGKHVARDLDWASKCSIQSRFIVPWRCFKLLL